MHHCYNSQNTIGRLLEYSNIYTSFYQSYFARVQTHPKASLPETYLRLIFYIMFTKSEINKNIKWSPVGNKSHTK